MFKNKKGILILITIVLLLSLSACSNEDKNNEINDIDLSETTNTGVGTNVVDEIIEEDVLEKESDFILSKKENLYLSDFYSDEMDINIAKEYIGKKYPNYTIKDKDGNLINLSDLNKPFVISHISATCYPCLFFESEVIEYQNSNIYDDNIEIYNVMHSPTDEDYESLYNHNPDSKGYSVYNTEDINISDFYKYGTPLTFYVDENLNIKLISYGAVEKDVLNENIEFFKNISDPVLVEEEAF